MNLSRNLYTARKLNSRLKTQVRLGKEDFILKVRIKAAYNMKEDVDLEVVDLNEFGPISGLDLNRN